MERRRFIKLISLPFRLLFLSSLAACGAPDYVKMHGHDSKGEATKYRKVDLELEQFVQDFESEWGQNIEFAVKLDNLKSGTDGECVSYTSGHKIVRIDNKFFQTGTLNQIDQVVMHEMGHCALGRNHDDTTAGEDDGTLPKSVMRTFGFNEVEANKYRDRKVSYMKELFK